MRKKIIGIFVCMLMIITCIAPVMGGLFSVKKDSTEINPLSESNTSLKFMIAGNELRALRSYWLHVPSSYDGSKPVPLVLVFHGNQFFNSTYPLVFFSRSLVENFTEFSQKADDEGFIVVYPNALLMVYDPLQTPWGYEKVYDYNLGWIPSVGWKYIDDIGFISDLIKKMEQNYNINSSRIYATGFSAGAFMTYSIGAYLSDVVAAIAPVAGTIGGRAYETEPFSCIPAPEDPVPVITFHGTADRNVPYHGSKYLLPVNTSISFWVEHNECNPVPEINISESGKINRTTYMNEENGAEVVLYTTKNYGHLWPGSPNHPDDEISATDLMWEFFEAHPKQ